MRLKYFCTPKELCNFLKTGELGKRSDDTLAVDSGIRCYTPHHRVDNRYSPDNLGAVLHLECDLPVLEVPWDYSDYPLKKNVLYIFSGVSAMIPAGTDPTSIWVRGFEIIDKTAAFKYKLKLWLHQIGFRKSPTDLSAQ